MRNIIRKGYTIEIKLPEECGYKGYSVECTYKYVKQINKYILTMWILRNDLDDKFKIDIQNVDMRYIHEDRNMVEDKIQEMIIKAGLSGFFTPYIERVEYICNCFDRGNTLYETERLENCKDGGVKNL